MTKVADVIIVGGGFTGSSLACALADGRREVLVLEAKAGPRTTFAGELLHPTGVEVLESLGLRSVLEQAGGSQITGFAVFPSASESATLLPYAGAPGIHTTGFAIDHGRMVEAMRAEAASRKGVKYEYGGRVEELLREDGRVVGVRTSEGRELHATLVLGAEGRHSRLRTALGIPVESKLLSYTAAILVRNGELPHPGHGHIFLGAIGPILAYPIGGGEVRMCFDLPSAVHPRELRKVLAEQFLPYVPAPLAEGLRLALNEETPQMVATHAMRAEEAVRDGMALVGDAGGCAHPLTAGGMTLCLNDVHLLGRALGGELSLSAALGRYERERVDMLVARIALTDALYEIFLGSGPGERALRSGIFRYWKKADARAHSVSLLAGAETRTRSLAFEYARVLGETLRSPGDSPVAAIKTALRHGAKFLSA